MKTIIFGLLLVMASSCISLSPITRSPADNIAPKGPPDVTLPKQGQPRKRTPNRVSKVVKSLLQSAKKNLVGEDLDLAQSYTERAYRIAYDDPNVSLMMAMVLFAKGDDYQAEQWALKSIDLWPENRAYRKRDSWTLVSKCRLRRGDWQGANQAIVESNRQPG